MIFQIIIDRKAVAVKIKIIYLLCPHINLFAVYCNLSYRRGIAYKRRGVYVIENVALFGTLYGDILHMSVPREHEIHSRIGKTRSNFVIVCKHILFRE